MMSMLRLLSVIVSGLAGLASIYLILQPNGIPHRTPLLLGSVTLLLATTLFNGIASLLSWQTADGSPDAAANARASAVDREVHGEVVKIIAVLGSQVEAANTFTDALNRASDACRMHFYKAFLEVLATRLSLANSRIANL